jgi:hypothetical protein
MSAIKIKFDVETSKEEMAKRGSRVCVCTYVILEIDYENRRLMGACTFGNDRYVVLLW